MITNGDWDEDEIAQRKADLFFEELHLKKDNRILLIIDDTYNEKKGKHTEGVGKFFDHSKGLIWGNNIVTSVLQAKGLFIPHKAKIYVKKEDAGTDFKSKIQIAIKDIIRPLKIPAGTKLMVVFDSRWYSAMLIKSCRDLGYHITCQIKSNKKVLLNNQDALSVKAYAKRFDKEDFKEISIKAKGKRRSYFIVEQLVSLDKSSQVRLVISKETIYEDRWILRLLIERQTRSWDSKIISFGARRQLRGLCNWFSPYGLTFCWLRLRVPHRERKRKLLARWLIKSDRNLLSI